MGQRCPIWESILTMEAIWNSAFKHLAPPKGATELAHYISHHLIPTSPQDYCPQLQNPKLAKSGQLIHCFLRDSSGPKLELVEALASS